MKPAIALSLGIVIGANLPAFAAESKDLSAGVPAAVAPAASQTIKARYETAAKIASVAERDKEYAVLVGYAAGAGDFELAMDIAGHMSAAGPRDSCYARIVHQAMKVGDLAAADRAAEKISSVVLRDEQFKKIAESCPANTRTEEAASLLGLDGGKPAGSVHRPDRAR